jgi:hypothetical protein
MRVIYIIGGGIIDSRKGKLRNKHGFFVVWHRVPRGDGFLRK